MTQHFYTVGLRPLGFCIYQLVLLRSGLMNCSVLLPVTHFSPVPRPPVSSLGPAAPDPGTSFNPLRLMLSHNACHSALDPRSPSTLGGLSGPTPLSPVQVPYQLHSLALHFTAPHPLHSIIFRNKHINALKCF